MNNILSFRIIRTLNSERFEAFSDIEPDIGDWVGG